MEDSYRTIRRSGPEILFKEKKSKFYAQAFPLATESEVQEILDRVRKSHPGAGHVCYAWRLGPMGEHYRANDDGEPANSAGMPIFGQLRAVDLTHVLVTVTREFGGVKLGVGGLIQAYKTAARMALDEADVTVHLIKDTFRLEFGYPDLDKVMRMISQLDADILQQDMKMSCSITLSLPKGKVDEMYQLMKPHHEVRIQSIL